MLHSFQNAKKVDFSCSLKRLKKKTKEIIFLGRSQAIVFWGRSQVIVPVNWYKTQATISVFGIQQKKQL